MQIYEISVNVKTFLISSMGRNSRLHWGRARGQILNNATRIARESWQVYLAMFVSVLTLMFFCATFIWQEGRLEQARISDIKYHYILMNGGVNTEGLDSIQSWFRDPERVKQIEDEVKAYEDRVQETARALDQKQRLEEKINELNSQNTNKKSRK